MNRSVVLLKSSGLFARRLHTWPCHMVLAIEETCSAVRWATFENRTGWKSTWIYDYMVFGSQSEVWFSGTAQQRTLIPNRIAGETSFYVDIHDIFKNTKQLLAHREQCMVYILSFHWYILWVNDPDTLIPMVATPISPLHSVPAQTLCDSKLLKAYRVELHSKNWRDCSLSQQKLPIEIHVKLSWRSRWVQHAARPQQKDTWPRPIWLTACWGMWDNIAGGATGAARAAWRQIFL